MRFRIFAVSFIWTFIGIGFLLGFAATAAHFLPFNQAFVLSVFATLFAPLFFVPIDRVLKQSKRRRAVRENKFYDSWELQDLV